MSKLHLEGRRLAFFCPGCECFHVVEGNWTLRGEAEKPTIKPSIMVIGEHNCHSYISKGTIRFLGDSSHKLSKQIVDLPEIEEGKWLDLF